MTETPGIPVHTADEQSVPAEYRFEAFHEANAPLCDIGSIGEVEDFSFSTIDYLVDDLLVSRLRLGPQTLRRTSRHLRNGTTDWIAVQIHHQGGMRGKAGNDKSIDLNPTRIGIIDFAEPFTAWSAQSDATWICVPRSRVDEAAITGPAGSLDRSSLRGRVLDAAVDGLWRDLNSARADDAEDLAAGIAETINTILNPNDFTPTDRDLGLAMQDFIKANLSDLDLGVETLPARFHCSRAMVYRLFEEHGGIATYIRDQRLLRCFEELARPAKLPRRVSEVANRWGFENPSHFNRIFKAKFGLPPSHLAGTAPPEPEYSPYPGFSEQVVEFHEWIKA